MREAAPSLLYGCITHVPPWVEMPAFVSLIRLGAAQDTVAGGHTLRELAPEWEPHHPVVGGTVGAFALKALLLRSAERPAQVGVCQYRKFVSRERVARQRARGYKVMEALPRGDVDADRLARWLQPGGAPFVICPPFRMAREGGYLGQYGSHHFAEDLLRFTAEAVELGVLGGREAADFLAESVFIPGGVELGVYPTDFWLPAITAVEDVVRACVRRHPTSREGTQARVWAYCAERLGSWLLVRHFRGADRRPDPPWWSPTHWRRRVAGHMNLILDEGQAQYHVGR